MPVEGKFLGFSFTGEREPRRRIAPKAIARFKERIRERTHRTCGINLGQMVKEITRVFQKVKLFFRQITDPRLVLVHRQFQLRHHRPHLGQSLLRSNSTADDD